MMSAVLLRTRPLATANSEQAASRQRAGSALPASRVSSAAQVAGSVTIQLGHELINLLQYNVIKLMQ